MSLTIKEGSPIFIAFCNGTNMHADYSAPLIYTEDTVPDPQIVAEHVHIIRYAPQPIGYWKYWDGWVGNHDQRIDDAECSICGYKHPTIRAPKGSWDFHTPDLLSEFCAGCGAKMRKEPPPADN